MSRGNITRSVAAMPKNLALHSAARGLAAAFIFLLQRYALSATLETSLLWAVVFGGCAAGLAYSQTKR